MHNAKYKDVAAMQQAAKQYAAAHKKPSGPTTTKPGNPPPHSNPVGRLPRSNGHWEGTPGNGLWHSDLPEVRAITGGKPVRFVNGRPDFSPWAKGRINFKPGKLNGTDSDFDLVYEKIAELKKLPNKTAGKNWLREHELTPHHLNKTTIELVPTDLHGNIPHVGAASDMRGGY